MSKKLLVLCFVLLASVMLTQATTVITGMNWDSPFIEPFPARANDYHVKGIVRSAGNVMPTLHSSWGWDNAHVTTWHLNGLSLRQLPNDPGAWEFEADFITDNGGIVFNGAMCHFGIEFKTNVYNYLIMLDAYWTYNGVRVADAVVTGFHVWEDVQRGVRLQLRNDLVNRQVMTMANVQVAVTDKEIPLPAMSRDFVGLPGAAPVKEFADIKWVNVANKVVLEPGKTFDLDLRTVGLVPAEGQFVQVRFLDPFTGAGAWMQHGHTAQPEPVR